MNRTRRAARHAIHPSGPGARPRFRLESWPTDPAVGHLIALDHAAVLGESELAAWVRRARRSGFGTLRTGALFPDAARAVTELGFEPLDSLALLRIELRPDTTTPALRALPDRTAIPSRSASGAARSPALSPDRRVQRLWTWHHAAAADLDQLAFGELWGNDQRSLAGIRQATPAHWARRIGPGHRLEAFAISGAGGRLGYLQRLAVHPACRRAGLARALVEDALAWMRSRHLTAALVNTSSTNLAALELYARLGFRRLDGHLTVAELRLDRDRA